jgi:uncharacterized protein YukE
MREVITFLLPQNNSLQLIFLFVICMLTIGVIVSTSIFARPKQWEKKWNGRDGSDGLDIDHGSVNDISSAVITGAEKLAEVMPGILLVIGLLGTFINLGIALDYASKILSQPHGVSAVDSAQTMNDIMGLLHGLGAKFKTSTWGIIGFLVLKVWSNINRYDERRLVWAIKKTKQEIVNKRKFSEDFDIRNMDRVTLAITALQDKYVTCIITSEERRNLQETAFFHRFESVLLDALGITNAILVESKDATKETSISMLEFKNGIGSLIQEIAGSAQRMAKSASHVGDAANELKSAVDSFKAQFTEVLDNIRINLGRAIEDMSQQAATTLLEGTSTLSAATNKISMALAALSNDVKGTMTTVEISINSSLNIQKNAHAMFVESSDNLNLNVLEMTNFVERLGDDIKSSLKSVSEVGRKMESIGHKLNNITELPATQEALLSEFKDLHDQLISYNHSLSRLLHKIANSTQISTEEGISVINGHDL